jgi:hypothetical protein
MNTIYNPLTNAHSFFKGISWAFRYGNRPSPQIEIALSPKPYCFFPVSSKSSAERIKGTFLKNSCVAASALLPALPNAIELHKSQASCCMRIASNSDSTRTVGRWLSYPNNEGFCILPVTSTYLGSQSFVCHSNRRIFNFTMCPKSSNKGITNLLLTFPKLAHKG